MALYGWIGFKLHKSVFLWSFIGLGSAITLPLICSPLLMALKLGPDGMLVFWTSATWLLTYPLVLKYGYIGVGIASAIVASTSLLTVYFVKKEIPVTVRLWANEIPKSIYTIPITDVLPDLTSKNDIAEIQAILEKEYGDF